MPFNDRFDGYFAAKEVKTVLTMTLRSLRERGTGRFSYAETNHQNGLITENELAAAKTVRVPYLNTQDQQKLVWAPSFALARAYLDQLARTSGLPADQIASARTTLAGAERRAANDRRTALTQLATQLNTAASSSSDQAKVKMLSSTVTDLANGR